MSKPNSADLVGDARKKRDSVPGPAKRSRTRLLWFAAAGVVVVAIAVVVGALVLGGDNSGSGAGKQAGDTSSGATQSLPETAGRFVVALDDASVYSDQAKALTVIEPFAEPRCIQFLLEVRDSLNKDTAPKPPPRTDFARTSSKVVSVQENGDTGVVVTETNGQQETYNWLRQQDGRWLFTCQDMLGGVS
ncbi:hypothetical protein ACWDTI_20565 [Gordonia sp. NPDC003424]